MQPIAIYSFLWYTSFMKELGYSYLPTPLPSHLPQRTETPRLLNSRGEQRIPVSLHIELLGAEAELLPQIQVEKAVGHFDSVYGLSPDVVKRASAVPVFLVNKATMDRFSNLQVQEYVEACLRLYGCLDAKETTQFIARYKNSDTRWSQPTALHAVKTTNEEAVLIQQDSILRDKIIKHEMLHAVASKRFLKGSGFHPGPSDYVEGLLNIRRNNRLNEAATELLRIGADYPDASISELHQSVLGAEIYVFYREELLNLLRSLVATNLPGGQPIGLHEVADCYLGKNTDSPADAVYAFRRKIYNSVDPEKRDEISELL